MTRRVSAACLVAAAVLSGCSVASVAPLPQAVAARDQSDRERAWDVWNCKAEAGYDTGYNPTDSPLANFVQKVFFWGTAGAAFGGLITGFPTSVASTASDGLIAGASAGGVTGALVGFGSEARFERAWVACMEAHGYAVPLYRPVWAPTDGAAPSPP